MAFARWWYAMHGDKKGSEASSKPGDRNTAVAEKKAAPDVSQPPRMQTSGTPAAAQQQPPSVGASKPQVVKPTETKPTAAAPQMEPGKNTEPTKAKDSQNKQLSEEGRREPTAEKSQSSPPVTAASDPKNAGQVTAASDPKNAGQVTAASDSKNAGQVTAASDSKNAGQVTAAGAAQPPPAASAGTAQPKPEKLSTTASAVGAGTTSPGVVAAADKPSAEPGMDESALDSLIDTLAGPEEDVPPSPVYTGPEVTEDISSRYLEELGIREGSLPPDYLKLLKSKGDGRGGVPPKADEQDEKPMTEDELAEALSSGFTCSAASAGGSETALTQKPSKEGEILQAQTATSVKTSAPPKEKTTKAEEVGTGTQTATSVKTSAPPKEKTTEAEEVGTGTQTATSVKISAPPKEKTTKAEEVGTGTQTATSVKTSAPPKEKTTKAEEEVKEDAMEALLDTLGGPEPEPEQDLTPVVEVSEAKTKEKKEEKLGERDDTIPPEHRLKPELDKDGKPILPKPEEQPKPLSESDLVDEFSKDFSCPAQPSAQMRPTKPSSTSKKPSTAVPAKLLEDAAVPRATACTVQSSAPSAVSSVGQLEDEALEALSSSLGKREPDPDEKKPAVDKVKEKTKQEQHNKLGEDEETIPPEYRFTAAKDQDGKPLLPKPEEKPQLLSENDLLEGLTAGFACSSPAPSPAAKKAKRGAKPAGSSEVLSAAAAPSVHSAAPPAPTSRGKEMDEALDLLSDSLGQREPDPDEDKPVVDKVKEKAKSEKKEKLGEREETLPPDYRKLLGPGEQGKPGKPAAKEGDKRREKKKAADAAIDALAGDFGTCAQAAATPQLSKDSSGREATNSRSTPKEKAKPKDSKKARGQSSSSKPEKQKTS